MKNITKFNSKSKLKEIGPEKAEVFFFCDLYLSLISTLILHL